MLYVATVFELAVLWYVSYKLPLNITAKRYQRDGSLPVWPFWLCGFLGWVLVGVMSILFAPSFSSSSVVTSSLAPDLNKLCWLFAFAFPVRACKRRAAICTSSGKSIEK